MQFCDACGKQVKRVYTIESGQEVCASCYAELVPGAPPPLRAARAVPRITELVTANALLSALIVVMTLVAGGVVVWVAVEVGHGPAAAKPAGLGVSYDQLRVMFPPKRGWVWTRTHANRAVASNHERPWLSLVADGPTQGITSLRGEARTHSLGEGHDLLGLKIITLSQEIHAGCRLRLTVLFDRKGETIILDVEDVNASLTN